jgi:hypothetical protein
MYCGMISYKVYIVSADGIAVVIIVIEPSALILPAFSLVSNA